MPQELDRKRVERLAIAIGSAIKAAYHEPPSLRPGESTRTLEVLNGLAFAAATVLAGTGNDAQAFGFFMDAVLENIPICMAMLERAEH
jgi:hypothetical protein